MPKHDQVVEHDSLSLEFVETACPLGLLLLDDLGIDLSEQGLLFSDPEVPLVAVLLLHPALGHR